MTQEVWIASGVVTIAYALFLLWMIFRINDLSVKIALFLYFLLSPIIGFTILPAFIASYPIISRRAAGTLDYVDACRGLYSISGTIILWPVQAIIGIQIAHALRIYEDMWGFGSLILVFYGIPIYLCIGLAAHLICFLILKNLRYNADMAVRVDPRLGRYNRKPLLKQ